MVPMAYAREHPFIQQLERAAKSLAAGTCRATVILGGDDFLTHFAIDQLRQILASDHALAWQALEGAQVGSPTAWQQWLRGSDLFSRRHCYVIKRLASPTLAKDIWQEIARCQDQKQVFILEWPKGQPPPKLGERDGFIDTAHIRPYQALAFGKLFAAAHAVKLEPCAVRLLEAGGGGDVYLWYNAIHILAGSGKTRIRGEDVRPLLPEWHDEDLFRIADQILAGDLPLLQTTVEELLLGQASALSLVAVIASHLRVAMKVQAGLLKNLSDPQLCQVAQRPAFVVARYRTYCHRKPLPVLLQGIKLCQAIDVELKSTFGQRKDERALQELISLVI